jgi:hypothetical protein
LSDGVLTRIAEQQPQSAKRFLSLCKAYGATTRKLEMVDEAISAQELTISGSLDRFHHKYVGEPDRAAQNSLPAS